MWCNSMNFNVYIDNVLSTTRVYLNTALSPKRIIINTMDLTLTGLRVVKLEGITVIGLHSYATTFNVQFLDPCLTQSLSLDP